MTASASVQGAMSGMLEVSLHALSKANRTFDLTSTDTLKPFLVFTTRPTLANAGADGDTI